MPSDQSSHPLDPLFRPRSVAVIGASRDPTKRGHQAVRALLDAGYAGRIIPVNPSGGELLGLPVTRAIEELSTSVDLALVCTPAPTVPQVLESCAERGVRAAVVLAVGFGEAGASGAALEDAVREIARRTGIRVVGPNTSGILNVPLGLNGIGIRGVRPGGLSLLVQSGNLALALLTEAANRSEQGFSIVVGVGNETDLGFPDYLDYLAGDANTRAILMHTEGVRDGRAFLEAARRVSARKPIVLLKGARTEVGGVAARSHTGAVAGSYAVFRAALRQAGVIEVTRTDELLAVGETLASQPPLRSGAGIAIVSDGGGHGALAADALHERNVPLATLSSATREALRELLGPAAAVDNPVDLAGAADRDPAVFARAVEIVAADEAVGGVLVIGLFGGYHLRFDDSLRDVEAEAARAMAAGVRNTGVALIVHSLYAATDTQPLRTLREQNVSVIESLEVACRCVAALWERSAAAERAMQSPSPVAAPERKAAPDLFLPARREGRAVLLETETRALLRAYWVPLLTAVFCRSAYEAAAATKKFGGPVAVRVVASGAPHKSDAGGVLLGVEGAASAFAAYERITEAVREHTRSRGIDADLRGVLVSPMIPPPVAELLVGVHRDPRFGPVLTVGVGGTLVEVHRDVALRVLPVAATEVEQMLRELRIALLLAGTRGKPAVDRTALVNLILALAQCALAEDEIEELEINPVFAYPDHAIAVDVRAYLTTGR